jgi:transposase
VIRYLRAGKSPKEIAFIIHKSVETVWKMIRRYEEVRHAYDQTYQLRYPQKAYPPPDLVKASA